MGVSIEEVEWCYRALLGREPESEEALCSHLFHDDFKALVESFVYCQEYSTNRRTAIPGTPPESAPSLVHRMDLRPNEVDSTATAEELAACVAVVRSAWAHLGDVKPHYSVLTNERFLPENLPGSLDLFWGSGEAEAAAAQRSLGYYGFAGLESKTCVEYGCGVGRVSFGLAKRFAKVYGYDISPGHLKVARQRALELGMANADFRLCPDSEVGDIEPCDFFYSKIVFQHNPPPLIAELIRRVLEALLPGGIAIFQVPTYGAGYGFKLRNWLNASHDLNMQMHCLPQQRIFEIVHAENCLPLEVREDNFTGAPGRYISNTFVIRKRDQATRDGPE